MAGGKVHGKGGAKRHNLLEGPRRLKHEERRKKRLAKHVEANAKAVLSRTIRAHNVFLWGRAQLEAASMERKKGTIDQLGFLFRQLAINKVVYEKLPKKTVLVGNKVAVFGGEARNILNKTQLEDIFERIHESHRYANADVKAKVRKWELKLSGTLPKE